MQARIIFLFIFALLATSLPAQAARKSTCQVYEGTVGGIAATVIGTRVYEGDSGSIQAGNIRGNKIYEGDSNTLLAGTLRGIYIYEGDSRDLVAGNVRGKFVYEGNILDNPGLIAGHFTGCTGVQAAAAGLLLLLRH